MALVFPLYFAKILTYKASLLLDPMKTVESVSLSYYNCSSLGGVVVQFG